MHEKFAWKAEDIPNINNFLVVRGYKFCTTSVDPEQISRACYALPSSPDKMDDWICRHLDNAQARELYHFVLRERQNT